MLKGLFQENKNKRLFATHSTPDLSLSALPNLTFPLTPYLRDPIIKNDLSYVRYFFGWE